MVANGSYYEKGALKAFEKFDEAHLFTDTELDKTYVLVVTDRLLKKKIYFAGYDPAQKGCCNWSDSLVGAVNILCEHAERLRRYLIINSIFNMDFFRLEIVCTKDMTTTSLNYIKNITAQKTK